MDKVGRAGMKVGDLLDPTLFHDKLQAAVEEKNFVLTRQFGAEPVDYAAIAAQFDEFAAQLGPYVGNVSVVLDQACRQGKTFCSKAPRVPSWTSTTAPIPLSPRPTPLPATPASVPGSGRCTSTR